MPRDDTALVNLVRAIVAHDHHQVARALAASPPLATTALRGGATRREPDNRFFPTIATTSTRVIRRCTWRRPRTT